MKGNCVKYTLAKEIYIKNYLCSSLNVLVVSLAFSIITLDGYQVSGLLIWVLTTINETSTVADPENSYWGLLLIFLSENAFISNIQEKLKQLFTLENDY